MRLHLLLPQHLRIENTHRDIGVLDGLPRTLSSVHEYMTLRKRQRARKPPSDSFPRPSGVTSDDPILTH